MKREWWYGADERIRIAPRTCPECGEVHVVWEDVSIALTRLNRYGGRFTVEVDSPIVMHGQRFDVPGDAPDESVWGKLWHIIRGALEMRRCSQSPRACPLIGRATNHRRRTCGDPYSPSEHYAG